MAKISDANIAGFAKQAGLSGSSIAIAVAVAIAESGGNTDAFNGLSPDLSYGLWQINMLGSMGPERRRQFGISSNEELFNPAINAKAMAMISRNGSNWTPWTTYTRGTYRAYLARGQAAAGNPALPIPSDSIGGATPVAMGPNLDNLMEFLDQFTNPGTWIRFGIIIGGAVAVFLGVSRLSGLGTGIAKAVKP